MESEQTQIAPAVEQGCRVGRLEIEEKHYPNPDYQYGIFRVDGVEIGQAEKVEGGWVMRGGRKARTDRKIAIDLLRRNLRRAQERQKLAIKDAETARALLRAMETPPNNQVLPPG